MYSIYIYIHLQPWEKKDKKLSPTPSPPPPLVFPRCRGCWCRCVGGWAWVVFPASPFSPPSLSCLLDESGSCLGLHFRKKASLQNREREWKRKSKKRVGCSEPKLQHFWGQYWALLIICWCLCGWWWGWSLVTTRTTSSSVSSSFSSVSSYPGQPGQYVSSFKKIKVTPWLEAKVCPFYFY